MNKLFLIKPIWENNPFDSEWDTMNGLVIIAETEEKARELLNEYYPSHLKRGVTYIDPKYFSCKEVSLEDTEEMILLNDVVCI